MVIINKLGYKKGDFAGCSFLSLSTMLRADSLQFLFYVDLVHLDPCLRTGLYREECSRENSPQMGGKDKSASEN